MGLALAKADREAMTDLTPLGGEACLTRRGSATLPVDAVTSSRPRHRSEALRSSRRARASDPWRQMNEADTCRRFVVPKLQAAGWETEPHSIAEQRTITDGRIVPAGKGFVRKPPKRVDYLLRYTRDFPLAIVEAKAAYKSAADAVQQARNYAEMLGLKFAYATNGHEVIEF